MDVQGNLTGTFGTDKPFVERDDVYQLWFLIDIRTDDVPRLIQIFLFVYLK